MKNEKANSYEYISLMVLFFISESLIYGTAKQSQKDIWFVILVSSLIALMFYQIYFKIMDYYPGLGLFAICREVFGKFLGDIIILLYTMYALYTATLILIDFKAILTMIHLTATPEVVILLIYGALMIFSLRSGVTNVCKCSLFFINFIIGFIIITTVFQIPLMDIERIRPFFQTDIKLILSGIFSAFTFPYGELFIFLAIIDTLKDTKNNKRVFIFTNLIGTSILFFLTVSQLLTLGFKEYQFSYFPAFMSVSRITVKFLQGLEILISTSLILIVFFKMIVYLLIACKGMGTFFNLKKYKVIVTPFTLYTILITLIQTESMMYHWEWIDEIWPYFSLPFIVFFPIILVISCYFKNRKSPQTKK